MACHGALVPTKSSCGSSSAAELEVRFVDGVIPMVRLEGGLTKANHDGFVRVDAAMPAVRRALCVGRPLFERLHGAKIFDATQRSYSEEAPPQSGEARASILSSLCFGWCFELLVTGLRRPLMHADLYDLVPSDRTAYHGRRLRASPRLAPPPRPPPPPRAARSRAGSAPTAR